MKKTCLKILLQGDRKINGSKTEGKPSPLSEKNIKIFESFLRREAWQGMKVEKREKCLNQCPP